MSSAILSGMLDSYSCQSGQDAINALREIMQSIALMALSRGGFFNHAAFYGGTALRMLYGLNRGSEDMDFSLLSADTKFHLSDYASCMKKEFASFGLDATFAVKLKLERTNIQAGFLKGNTQAQLLCIGLDKALARRIHSRSEMKIKVEVDVCPPGGFSTEVKYLYQPLPFAVRAYALPDLLAGKLHAVLFRRWGSRVKGRDWFDLAWYAGRHAEYDLGHLESRARQFGDYTDDAPLTDERLHQMLVERLAQVDITALKEDVLPFVRDVRSLELWSREFFLDVFSRLHPHRSSLEMGAGGERGQRVRRK